MLTRRPNAHTLGPRGARADIVTRCWDLGVLGAETARIGHFTRKGGVRGVPQPVCDPVHNG